MLAAAVVEAEAHAEMLVTKWREGFVGTVAALHTLRMGEAKADKAAKYAARPPLATRVWTRVPKTVGAAVGLATWSVVTFYKFVKWAVKLYMAGASHGLRHVGVSDKMSVCVRLNVRVCL